MQSKNNRIKGNMMIIFLILISVFIVSAEPFQYKSNAWVSGSCGDGFEYGDIKATVNEQQGNCWKIADGSLGTIDLRSRFLIGAWDGNYTLNSEGGTSRVIVGSGNIAANSVVTGVTGNAKAYGTLAGTQSVIETLTVTKNSLGGQALSILNPYHAVIFKECMCK